MIVRIILLFHLFLLALGLFAQSDKTQTYSNECSRDVCLKVKFIADSLISKGIDTILTYKFLPGNGYGGYGKVLWIERGVTKQCLIDTDLKKTKLRPVVYSKLSQVSTFQFYLKSKIDTATNPKDEELESVSHDPKHFVWVTIRDNSHSFVIPQSLAFYYPSYILSQFVALLMKPSHLQEMKQLQKQIAKRNLR